MKTFNFDPIVIFQEVWELFKNTYGGFETKKINWKKLHEVYLTKIHKNCTEEELFDLITDMLKHLNDPHVQLKSNDLNKHFFSGKIGEIVEQIGFDQMREVFNSKPVADHYFKNELKSKGVFSYTWLDHQIAYVHFGEFDRLQETEECIAFIIEYFSSSKAMILDIRRNKGGDDRVGKAIADCFVDKKRNYLFTTSTKNASEQKTWFTAPNNKVNYSKPLALLIDQTTFSAAENFTLAMREIPQISLIGDSTTGGFADAEWKELSCGWNVCIPFGLFTDKNGFCWEGIGIPAHYKIKTDALTQKIEFDSLIEFALDLLTCSE